MFDRKVCAVTSGDIKVDGELKKIEPLILPDPDSSKESEEESVKDAAYDEDYSGDNNHTKTKTWDVVRKYIYFSLVCLGRIISATVKIFFFQRKKNITWRKTSE